MEDSVINVLANDNYIIVNKSLIKEVGLKESILLGELAAEYNYYKNKNQLDEEGYFYSTIENVEENTSLSKYEQKKALEKLELRRLVFSKVKGIPATRHIKLNNLQLANLLINNLTSSCQKTSKLEGEFFNPNNNNNNKNNNKEINNINIIYKEKNFKKPTLEEVEEYCKERNNNINAQKFIDFYESKGWKVGKTPMKDWKACIRTWEGNNFNKPTNVVNELPERLNKDTETNEMTKEERDELDFLLGEITK